MLGLPQALYPVAPMAVEDVHPELPLPVQWLQYRPHVGNPQRRQLWGAIEWSWEKRGLKHSAQNLARSLITAPQSKHLLPDLLPLSLLTPWVRLHALQNLVFLVLAVKMG